MPKGMSINQQYGKLLPLLFESRGAAETNFFLPKIMFPYGQIYAISLCTLNCCIMRL